MQVGILGAGRIGKALARHFTKAGHQVVLANSRGPETLAGIVEELGPGARAGTVEEAFAAPILFLCVMWSDIPAAVAGLPPSDDRIVVDTSNPYKVVDGQLIPQDLGSRTSSEIVRDLLGGARLVKACNTLYSFVLASDPREAGGNRVLFVSGDDTEAKAQVGQLFEDVGFAVIDLGTLASGGRIQQGRGPLTAQNLIRLPNPA